MAKALCFVPGCVTPSHAGGMCGLHYMEAYSGKPFTLPCPGIEFGLGCGKRHPLDELLKPLWDDPPPPPELVGACTLILRAYSRRSAA